MSASLHHKADLATLQLRSSLLTIFRQIKTARSLVVMGKAYRTAKDVRTSVAVRQTSPQISIVQSPFQPESRLRREQLWSRQLPQHSITTITLPNSGRTRPSLVPRFLSRPSAKTSPPAAATAAMAATTVAMAMAVNRPLQAAMISVRGVVRHDGLTGSVSPTTPDALASLPGFLFLGRRLNAPEECFSPWGGGVVDLRTAPQRRATSGWQPP